MNSGIHPWISDGDIFLCIILFDQISAISVDAEGKGTPLCYIPVKLISAFFSLWTVAGIFKIIY